MLALLVRESERPSTTEEYLTKHQLSKSHYVTMFIVHDLAEAVDAEAAIRELFDGELQPGVPWDAPAGTSRGCVFPMPVDFTSEDSNV